MVTNRELVLAEIEVVAEQQHLTEQEEAEIQRHQHRLDAQIQFAANLQADLDALRVLLLTAALPQPERSTNSNDYHQDTA